MDIFGYVLRLCWKISPFCEKFWSLKNDRAIAAKSAQQKMQLLTDNARRMHLPPVGDALQEPWITRCIGPAPLATMHPVRFGLPDPLGWVEWMGGGRLSSSRHFYFMQNAKECKKGLFALQNKSPLFTVCPFTA